MKTTTIKYCSMAVSVEWSQFRISLIDGLHSIRLNEYTLGFYPHFEVRSNHLVQRDKHHHSKVLLRSFYMNGYALGFFTHR